MMSAAWSAALATATAGTTAGPVGVQALSVPPLAFHPATPLSTPLMKKLFELVGRKFAPAPSTPSAVYGGLIENAAVSYCPTRRLPDGVYARAVTIYTGAIMRPAADAAVQLAYPIALATTSFPFTESQHTCEARLAPVWVESTSALGKVPFCFSVSRTHLYFTEEDVPV